MTLYDFQTKPELVIFAFRSRLHHREENYITDGAGTGHEHEQTVKTDAQACCWRHAIFQSLHEVFIYWMSFIIRSWQLI